MESEYFEGEVHDVRFFPFALREWEMRRVLRYWPEKYVNGKTVFVNEDASVDVVNGYSTETKLRMPRWFRAWLWLRTMHARL